MAAPADDELPIGLGAPARRALLRAGYLRLAQFADVCAEEVLVLHGMGPRAMERIRAALAEQGLAFLDEA